MSMLALVLAGAVTQGYPICVLTESVPGVISDVTCVGDLAYRSRRFCGFKEGTNPGGLFDNYNQPLRYEFLTEFCPIEELDQNGWCLTRRITGYADFKEVARNEEGVAVATAVIKQGWKPFPDSFEPMDLFAESACLVSITIP